ncbi:MAG: hypothetical protein QF676_04200 [Dehalococcoidia bacterium]|nr:hypothetical protein [Chloroflexota bacterium]MDP6055367.1 hypothetical protein [Dehalococcoidia bacterium]MDP7261782.1 hypothetical protein [Dehalococcoidia bacterium]
MDISLKFALWGVFWRHVKAAPRRNNRHPGWRLLFRIMRIIRRSYRSTETDNIDDDDQSVLTLAKIRAKVLQQPHRVLRLGRNPNINEILALTNSK